MSGSNSSLALSGELLPVVEVARRVCGRAITVRTALRWSITGRAGVPLPTMRGIHRTLCTTEPVFRQWLADTAAGIPLPPQPQKAPPDRAADAVLAGFGLARQEGNR